MTHLVRSIIAIIVFSAFISLVGQSLIHSFHAQLSSTRLLAAPIAIRDGLPKLKRGDQDLKLSARSFLSAYLTGDGKMEILIERDGGRQLPIASVTKLMTAWLVFRDYDLDTLVTIEPEDVKRPFSGEASSLRPGETFAVSTLLGSLLVESSNYSAQALARQSAESFPNRMNREAKALGMKHTYFMNSSGLDGLDGEANFSSAYDLLILTRKIIEEGQDILTISRQTSLPISQASGSFHHLAQSTNKLLSVNKWPAEIVGGKTGQTIMARKNLVMVLRDQASDGYLVNIVLASDDHFADMERLVDWIYYTYDFSS